MSLWKTGWKRDLDTLKREALQQTIENPVVTDTTKQLARDIAGLPATAALDKARAVALRADPAQHHRPAEQIVYGWQVLMSRVRDPETGVYAWHLSAMLHPKNRPSLNTDWERLGRIIKYLGVPNPDPTLMPANPNHAHHWHWTEPTAAEPAAS